MKPIQDLPPGLRAALHFCSARLEQSGADAPRLSAELLLAKALGLDRNALLKRLILEPKAVLPRPALQEFAELIARRAAGEPAAYILGRKEFYGREFAVTPDTLIPRPETELLIDLALEYGRGPGFAGATPSFADFGTGTGCIAVTLALELPGWRGIAVEKSPSALRVARDNAARLGAKNLCLALGDFRIPPVAPASLDLLISNPPYVGEAEYRTLSREVRAFEPKSALVPCSGNRRTQAGRLSGIPPAGEASGLEDAEALLELARTLLKPGGLLLMETGSTQGPALLSRLQGWSKARLHKDLAGLDRVISGSPQDPGDPVFL